MKTDRLSGKYPINVPFSNKQNYGILRFPFNHSVLSDRYIPSFKGSKDKKTIIDCLIYNVAKAILAAEILSLSTTSFLENIISKPGNPSNNNGWKNNVTVLASCGQDGISKGFIKYSFYTRALADRLKRKNINSLEKANHDLVKHGYRNIILKQYPVQTQKKIEGWEKNEANSKRFVLLIGGKDTESLVTFCKNNVNLMEKTVKNADIFNVPDENIKKVYNVDSENFQEGMSWLIGNILKNQDQNVEVLIYYTGHGNIYDKNGNMEGDSLGMIENGITEPRLQGILRFPNNVKTTIIFDACHSGAFIN